MSVTPGTNHEAELGSAPILLDIKQPQADDAVYDLVRNVALKLA